MPKKIPNPIDKHVGARVRMRRMMLSMSQEKLGDALGLTFQQVQKYEKGSNRVSASRLYQISRVLGVPVQFFYDELKGDDDTSGFAESEGADAIAGALQSPDGVQIARIFSETTDPDKRKLILNAVKLLADYKGP